MTSVYPGALSSFTNPSGTNALNSPDHAGQHSDINDTVEAVQSVLGTTAGTSVLKNFQAGDFSPRINGSNVLQQTLSGTINNSVLGTPSVTGGTIASAVINSSTVGTPTITGGSWASGTLNNPVIGTPSLTGGTIANSLIGTSQHTGGTVTGAVIGTNTITGGTISISAGTLSTVVVNNSTIGTPGITGGTHNSFVAGTPTITGGTWSSGTLPNAVLGTPTLTVGSDATGDIFYRSSGGTVTRLAIGTSGQYLTTNGTTPSWGTVSGGSGGIGDGWTATSDSWTYASATTITIPAGGASLYQIGDRIKLTQTTVKYFYVTAVADTLLTITGGSDYTLVNAAISAISYSHIVNPLGFPHWMNYTATVGATGSMTFTSTSLEFSKFNMQSRAVTVLVRYSGTTGGTASNGLTFTIPVGTVDTASPSSGGFVTDGSTLAGICLASSSTAFEVRRYDNANFGLGAGRRFATQCIYGV